MRCNVSTKDRIEHSCYRTEKPDQRIREFLQCKKGLLSTRKPFQLNLLFLLTGNICTSFLLTVSLYSFPPGEGYVIYMGRQYFIEIP